MFVSFLTRGMPLPRDAPGDSVSPGVPRRKFNARNFAEVTAQGYAQDCRLRREAK